MIYCAIQTACRQTKRWWTWSWEAAAATSVWECRAALVRTFINREKHETTFRICASLPFNGFKFFKLRISFVFVRRLCATYTFPVTCAPHISVCRRECSCIIFIFFIHITMLALLYDYDEQRETDRERERSTERKKRRKMNVCRDILYVCRLVVRLDLCRICGCVCRCQASHRKRWIAG